jgi:hypothetical protein
MARQKEVFSGGCSSVGRVQDCDSCCRGFEPHQPPHRIREEGSIRKCRAFFVFTSSLKEVTQRALALLLVLAGLLGLMAYAFMPTTSRPSMRSRRFSKAPPCFPSSWRYCCCPCCSSWPSCRGARWRAARLWRRLLGRAPPLPAGRGPGPGAWTGRLDLSRRYCAALPRHVQSGPRHLPFATPGCQRATVCCSPHPATGGSAAPTMALSGRPPSPNTKQPAS